MSKSIAVIGGGLFGAEIASEINIPGVDVSLYESKGDLLTGASANNQNRLHLGYHYPRDLETARQCILGFNKFTEKYKSAVFDKFDNIYAVSNIGSKTSYEEFLKLCMSLPLDFEVLTNDRYPIQIDNVSGAVLTNEVVYDFAKLRDSVWVNLKKANTKVFLNSEVTNIRRDNDKFLVEANGKYVKEYDYVFNCTYSNVEKFNKFLGIKNVSYKYQLTWIPIVEIDHPPIAITIVDGDFTTLLPYGKTGKFLLYHVTHSVLESCISNIIPEFIDQKSIHDYGVPEEMFCNLLDESRKFIPLLDHASYSGHLFGPRLTLANVDATDRRLSSLDEREKNYFTVLSGKIDQAIVISEMVNSIIKARL